MNEARIAVDLSRVQQTLLLPLWARAEASRMDSPVLRDDVAAHLVGRMDYDFSALRSGLGRFAAAYLTVRAREFDEIIRGYINVHPRATIVNVGAGLDTTFYRVDNGRLRWYNLDLPEVISLRRALLPAMPNLREIPKSLLDEDFPDGIEKPEDGILFLAGGVLMYFDEGAVKTFLKRLSARYPGGEILFDAVAPGALGFCNRVLRRSGMRDAEMKWGFRGGRSMERWEFGLQPLRQAPLFAHAPVSLFRWKTRCLMAAADAFSVLTVVRLRFAA